MYAAVLRPAPKKKKTAAAKLRSWRAIIMRSKGEHIGTVEAPNEKAAEAAAVADVRLQPNRWRGGTACHRGILSPCCRRWCATVSSRASADRAAATRYHGG